jgi:hypothetical protein
MENAEKYSHIKGWGIDANPRNEPTYPIKNYTGDDHKRLNYEKPPQQVKTVEVLHSNERPNLSAVYGTSVPPSGLSGMIRRFAFRYSESSFGHWIPLIFADRINVWEGFIKDFGNGRVPNIFAERGLKSELKYNKKNFITKTAVRTFITLAVIGLVCSGSMRRKRV